MMKIQIIDPDKKEMESPDEVCAVKTQELRICGRLVWRRQRELKHDLYIKEETRLIDIGVYVIRCRRCGKEVTVFDRD
ncbi:MAG: hypothetical protein ACTSPX_04905 [Candidatus Thorarchaeota archaeon]